MTGRGRTSGARNFRAVGDMLEEMVDILVLNHEALEDQGGFTVHLVHPLMVSYRCGSPCTSAFKTAVIGQCIAHVSLG